MKWLVSLLGFVSLAFASGTWDLDSGIQGIYLEYSNYSGEDRYTLACYDHFADLAISDPSTFDEKMQSSLDNFQSDTLLFCRATYEAGDPYFWVSDFQYVVDGFAYRVEYSDYIEVRGEQGRMRPGSMVDIGLVLRHIERPKTIQLYLEDDGTDFTFQELF